MKVTELGFYLLSGPLLRDDVVCIEIVEMTNSIGPLYRIHYADHSISDVEPLRDLLEESHSRPYLKLPDSFIKWVREGSHWKG